MTVLSGVKWRERRASAETAFGVIDNDVCIAV